MFGQHAQQNANFMRSRSERLETRSQCSTIWRDFQNHYICATYVYVSATYVYFQREKSHFLSMLLGKVFGRDVVNCMANFVERPKKLRAFEIFSRTRADSAQNFHHIRDKKHQHSPSCPQSWQHCNIVPILQIFRPFAGCFLSDHPEQG